jgi:hypothetical protein
MPFSTFIANKILDKVLRDAAFTGGALHVALHTADPGDTGASEVTGGSYARVAATTNWAVAATKHADNSAQFEFAGMPAVTVTHASLWDAATAGNFVWGGALSASKVVGAGDTFRFPIADVDLTLT